MEKIDNTSQEDEIKPKRVKWSAERAQKEIDELKRHPLFCRDMTDLDTNEELLALQSLLYDDDKLDELESAQIFKKHGDEIFRDRVVPLLKKGNLDKIEDPNLRLSLKGSRP